MKYQNAALKKAIGLAGGQTALAKMIGIRPSSMHSWGEIPIKRVIPIELALGSQITRYEMRPDYFGDGPTTGAG